MFSTGMARQPTVLLAADRGVWEVIGGCKNAVEHVILIGMRFSLRKRTRVSHSGVMYAVSWLLAGEQGGSVMSREMRQTT
jgi:hypothetical protein